MCNLQLASMGLSSKTSRTFLSSDPPFWTLCLGSEARDKPWRADSLRGTLGLSRSQEARAARRALHNGFPARLLLARQLCSSAGWKPIRPRGSQASPVPSCLYSGDEPLQAVCCLEFEGKLKTEGRVRTCLRKQWKYLGKSRGKWVGKERQGEQGRRRWLLNTVAERVSQTLVAFFRCTCLCMFIRSLFS